MYEIEKQFLITIIKNPEKIGNLEYQITEFTFRDPLFYQLYSKIVEFVMEKRIFTISDLKLAFHEDNIALKVIDEIYNTLPVTSLDEIYYKLLDLVQKDKIKELISKIKKSIPTTSSKDLLLEIETAVMNISSQGDERIKDIVSVLNDFLPEMERKIEEFTKNDNISSVIKLPTGIRMLDEYTLGFNTKSVWFLGGATGDGKTQLAVQMANNIIKTHQTVLYFLLEDCTENLLMRLIALKTNIKIKNIMTGRLSAAQKKTVYQARDSILDEGKLLVEDEIFNINEIVSKIKYAKLKYPDLKLVVLDYIQLALDPSQTLNSREQEISSISKKLLLTAKKTDVAVLVLGQLNTQPDDRKGKMPIRLNDIRESKAPSHDASVVIFLHYPNKFDDEAIEQHTDKNIAHILLEKNRYGETNKIIELQNKADIAKFIEI